MNIAGVLYCDEHGPLIREMDDFDSCGRVRVIM